MPNDLPYILYYRVGKTSRVTLPRRPVSFISTSGTTDAAEVCPTIPLGADAWRLGPDDPWQSLNTLPKEWLPFLKRKKRRE